MMNVRDVIYRAWQIIKQYKKISLGLAAGLLVLAGLCSWNTWQNYYAHRPWRLEFDDNFHRHALGSNWQAYWGGVTEVCRIDTATQVAPWQIKAHKLYGHGGSPTFLVCAQKLPGDIRAEVDLTVVPGHAGSMTFIFYADTTVRAGIAAAAGYSLVLGADSLAGNRLFKAGRQIGSTPRNVLSVGQKYQVTFEKQGYSITVRANGQLLFSVTDYEPLPIDQHNRLVLALDQGRMLVNRVRTYAPKRPTTTALLAPGDRLYEAGKFREALAVYQGLVNTSSAPDILEIALYKAGRCHEQLGNYMAAQEWYKRLENEHVASLPAPWARAHSGLCLLRMGKRTEAFAVFDACLRQFPASAALRDIMEIFSAQARAAQGSGDYETAINAYRRAVRYAVRPEDRADGAQFCYEIAVCRLKLKNPAAADSVMDDLAARFPDQRSACAEQFLNMARQYHLLGDSAKTALYCNRTLRSYPDVRSFSAAALGLLADLAPTEEKIRLYRKIGEEYADVRDQAAAALMYLAELYWGLGDAPRTEFCIRRVMQEYGDIRAAVFDALRFRARLYKSLGGMADAIQIYANLFRDYQDDPGRCLGAPVDIIKTYLEWGHYQPATEYLDSIDFARTDRYTGKQAGALALYYAATAHRMRDEFDMARPIYRQGITQYPGEPIAEIGKLMLGQADLDEIKKEWGAEDIEKCQVPDRAFDLAEWYLEHGEKKKARLWYQQVVKIDLKGDLWRVLAERRMEELEGKKKGKGE